MVCNNEMMGNGISLRAWLPMQSSKTESIQSKRELLGTENVINKLATKLKIPTSNELGD